MKLKEFLKNIEKMVEEDPSILELEVITATDDEGNGYNPSCFKPSVGNYEEGEFRSELERNVICIN